MSKERAPMPEITMPAAAHPVGDSLPESAPARPFQDELDAVLWIMDEVRHGRRLPVLEAQVAAHALHLSLPDRTGWLQLVPLHDMKEYVAVHAVNVALLSMALARQLDFDADAERRIGMAALLHDIGMARMPVDVLGKPGQISPDERERIKEHPVEGARILMEADPSLDLAVTVAYEHHVKVDGSGYPKFTFPRTCHYVSRLVQLCDIYHALRSPRPFRQPWPREIIVSYINERAGFEFHPALAATLTRVVQQQDPVS
jgi:putative nucleotidyltransferase with HDIG domain